MSVCTAHLLFTFLEEVDGAVGSFTSKRKGCKFLCSEWAQFWSAGLQGFAIKYAPTLFQVSKCLIQSIKAECCALLWFGLRFFTLNKQESKDYVSDEL